MSKIEPDLMKAVLPTLDEKYKGETAEQKATREARYAKAVEEYNRRFDAYALAWQSDLKTTQGGVLTTLETIDRDDESQTLAAFESTISQA